jgi:hypothetical protein
VWERRAGRHARAHVQRTLTAPARLSRVRSRIETRSLPTPGRL